ncbi:prepilin signal peptidase PulO-like enzyme (type II secretory pathway) [Thermocatellispora tengchongensis]|uniref:Prepilin signal peptidase PulO-like enzyme (Type II secretory pathway) n=1 Tax=Thermocatellispora tengchongensis TaxID=1073253 RepID=A0A840P0Y5_9ACTN|nr:A24 family peptidase [Thermocatellispora tengchongensis]MBB5131120.1 prepilin signal peptidase PulO-like enzyme (type II secretory pathway) [Thermocatellispora tengchongensis]
MVGWAVGLAVVVGVAAGRLQRECVVAERWREAGVAGLGGAGGLGWGRFSAVTVLGLLAVGVALGGRPGEVVAAGWLVVVGVPLVLIDVGLLRLPDPLTGLAYVGVLAALGGAAVAAGRYDALGRAALAGVALAGFYLVMFVISPAGVGLGDVKLAGALGTALGWYGWGQVAAGTFAAYALAAAYGLGLMALRGAGRKTELPFGPFMLLGALAVICHAGAGG